MKKITLLLVIIFTFLFSTTSWGEWELSSKNLNGTKFYYDKDRVRKSGKYFYFWELVNYSNTEDGIFSTTLYVQLDCSIFRNKYLKRQNYKNWMGEGEMISDMTPPDEWEYPKPNTSGETLYNKICEEHQ